METRLVYCSGCSEWHAPDAFMYASKYAVSQQTSWRGDTLNRLCLRCDALCEPRPCVYRLRHGSDSYVGSCVLGPQVRYREHLYSSTVYCDGQEIHRRMAATGPEEWAFEVVQEGCEPWCLKQYELAWICLTWPNLNMTERVVAKDDYASRYVGDHEYPRAMVRFYLEEDDEGREVVRLDHSEPRPWPPKGVMRRDQWLEYFLGRIEFSWGEKAHGRRCERCWDHGHGNECPIAAMDNWGPADPVEVPEYEEGFGVPEAVMAV